MTARLTIAAIGPGATIQDRGRFGWLRFGVTPAGPMDWAAFATANRALENPPTAAAIEIGPGGAALTTDRPVRLAVAGGAFDWTRAGEPIGGAAVLWLRPGETLQARPGRQGGTFCYCAVPGGVDVPLVMGSRATHQRSGLGGVEGRALRAGDVVTAGGSDPCLDEGVIDAPWLAMRDAPLRVLLGPQDDHFTPAAVATLLTSAYRLSPFADRMAYKLEGPPLEHARDFNIVSDGIALGAIQVAGDGQPMVLMADRQPTGGYPKIAHVCRADIGRLAQGRPGTVFRFERVTEAAARDALFALEATIATSPLQLAPFRRTPDAARLAEANLIDGVVSALSDLDPPGRKAR
jgi:biotin-dependent carboxylase-like uncharacterized protein